MRALPGPGDLRVDPRAAGAHGTARRVARTTFVWCGAAAAFALAGPARAQTGRPVSPAGFTVVPRNDLTFGNLARGMPSTISPLDYHAATFEISGPPNTPVRIEFVLPRGLESPDGRDVPLSFGPGDGFAETGNATQRGTSFNPRQPLIITLGQDGRLLLHVGATAHADRLQRNGAYRAPIFVNLYGLGN